MSVVIITLHGFGFLAMPLASAQNDIEPYVDFAYQYDLIQELWHFLP